MSSSSALMKKLKDQARQVKTAAENRGSGEQYEKTDWFKPEIGENPIRFLPHWKRPDSELGWIQVKLHFISVKKNDGTLISGVPARCMADFNEDCPLCSAYEKVVKTDKEAARRLRATTRYLFNVMNYKTRKVQPYACGQQIYEILMGWVGDIEGNIFDVDAGYDFKLIKIQKAGQPKLTGTSYQLRPIMKVSAVPEKLKTLVESMPDLSKLYATKELAAMYEFIGVSAPEKDEEEEEEEEEKPRKSSSMDRAKAAAAKVKAKAVEEDEDEEDDDDLEEEAPKSKKSAPAKKKKDEDIDDVDDELERELRELGV